MEKINNHKFPYDWNLKDAVFTKDKGKVFSCFSCGGGSTMGYKLAGFDVIGCNEIDPRLMETYKINHNPKYSFIENITTFKLREDLPQELYELDILDGSPPCSSFSIAGNRGKDWGKSKAFAEGQVVQILDTLFFDFIDLAKKLQPKVVVAENVKGLLMDGASKYVRKIYREFDLAGYYVQHWVLNASKMGVPQTRERVFFIAIRKNLAISFLKLVGLFELIPQLQLVFDEPPIVYGEFADYTGPSISEHAKKAWDKRKYGDNNIAVSKARAGMHISSTSTFYLYDDHVAKTITSKGHHGSLLFSKPLYLSKNELCNISTFPKDYNFIFNPGFIMGMSVPPVMMAQISTQIYEQWLKFI